jgi:hypothetical protein
MKSGNKHKNAESKLKFTLSVYELLRNDKLDEDHYWQAMFAICLLPFDFACAE